MRVAVSGQNSLAGRVEIGGYKHSVLPILAASIATPMVVHLTRVPAITDVDSICQALVLLGAHIEYGEQCLKVDTTALRNINIPPSLTSRFHASYQLMPALLVRFGEFMVGLPGGCAIGDRVPYGCFAVLRSLGAGVEIEGGYCRGKLIRSTGPQTIRLRSDLGLDIKNLPSGTKTAMIAAAFGQQRLQIEEAFMAPEIIDLGCFLSEIGCRIVGAGTSTVEIQGGHQPERVTASYPVMPDLNEAFTYLVLSVLHSGEVSVVGVMPQYLREELDVLSQMGVVLAIGKEGIRAFAPNGLVAASTATGSYPAFGTDNHPVLAALMTRASGYSRITETIWEDRFAYVTGLSKLMTRIWYAGRTVHVRPEKWTSGTCYIRCTDLRGGAAVTIAALGRMDDTILDNFEVVLRGYSRFVERLNGLGADLRIV